jgi:hypothetical protein
MAEWVRASCDGPCDTGGMVTYRIVPKRGGYCIEATEGSRVTVIKTWPTEELAIAHLRALPTAADRRAFPSLP